jgi:hypothetical protein
MGGGKLHSSGKILGDLEAEDLVRNSPFRSIDKKELWGASAIVGMAPRL